MYVTHLDIDREEARIQNLLYQLGGEVMHKLQDSENKEEILKSIALLNSEISKSFTNFKEKK